MNVNIFQEIFLNEASFGFLERVFNLDQLPGPGTILGHTGDCIIISSSNRRYSRAKSEPVHFRNRSYLNSWLGLMEAAGWKRKN